MEPLLFAFLITMLIQLLMFIPAFLFKTDKLTDMSYGLTFIILVLLFVKDLSLPKLLLGAMIIIWAVRLITYLFIRIRKIQKDKRFDGIRENFLKFLGFWTLQGVSVFLIMICSLLYFDSVAVFSSLSIIGLFIWLSGLLIEGIADYQKFTFNNNPKNKGKWISSGVWKYSRHPNYLGEIMCWVGIYVFSFTSLSQINKLIALISPVFITFLLLFVSGIPILEKKADEKWGKDKKYLQYKKKTSVLIPYQGLILSVAICLSAGFIGSFFTISSIGSWYSTLNKPFFNPPNWLFGPVWTFLYILMGISLYLAVKNGADKKTLIIFSQQLLLNTVWSILFFGLQNPFFAFIEIIILWLFIFLTILSFSKYSRLSAYLLLPYLFWVTFAAFLNSAIIYLN